MPVLTLSEADVRSLLTMPVAVSAVEAAFRKLALDEAENVPRQRCQTDRAMLHVLPAAAKTLGALGLKAYTTTRAAARFHVYLYDSREGHLAAILEADFLGQMRTGAASAVATRKLARVDASVVGIYGTGLQARTQLEAIASVRTLKRVQAFGRDAERRAAFCREMGAKLGVECVPVENPADAAAGADILVTATTSREPVLLGEWVRPGMHVNLTGSNFLAKAEADAELFRRATRVTVDSKDQSRLEAGDFVAAMQEKVLAWSEVLELSHVLIGRYPGRETPEDVTVFKSLGLGIEDIAVAARVVELARKGGVGRELELFGAGA